MAYLRWTEALEFAAYGCVLDKQPFSILDESGEQEHWDWDLGKSSWRRLKYHFESSRFTDDDAVEAVKGAIAFAPLVRRTGVPEPVSEPPITEPDSPRTRSSQRMAAVKVPENKDE